MKFFILLSILASSALALHVPSDSFIIGGVDNVARDDYHFMVFISDIVGSSDGNLACGGTILNENTIVTAASCLHGATSALVKAGVHNINDNDENPFPQMIDVTADDFVVHPSFVPGQSFAGYDIGLIILSENDTLIFDEYVSRIPFCANNEPFNGRPHATAGWGYTSNGGQAPEEIHELVDLVITEDIPCQNLEGLFNFATDICFLPSNGESPCLGDTGNAIVENNVNAELLVGVTSFGYQQNCQQTEAIASTSIAVFIDWIAENSGYLCPGF